MKKNILFLVITIFASCAPTKLLKEQLKTQTETTTDIRSELESTQKDLKKTKIERDSFETLSLIFQNRYESSESEKKKLLEQLNVEKKKVEYYEDGKIKSEETTSINKSTESSSESYKKTISELQSELNKKIEQNEKLESDKESLTKTNYDLSESIKEQSDTITKLQSKQTGKDVIWWTGLGCILLVFGYFVYRLSKFFRKL